MSFLLSQRGSSTSFVRAKAELIRDRLPNEGEIFQEGYLCKRADGVISNVSSFVQSGGTWAQRMFAILHQGKLTLHASWSALRDDVAPKDTILILPDTKVELVEESRFKKDFVFSVDDLTFFACETRVQAAKWVYVLNLEIKRQRMGGSFDGDVPKCRARFFEGMLFKTPPDNDRWEERHFELEGDTGDLSYRATQGSTSRKTTISLETAKVIPNATAARGTPSPYYFQIHAFLKEEKTDKYVKRIFNLAAPSKLDYLNWLKALRVWVGVKKPAFAAEIDAFKSAGNLINNKPSRNRIDVEESDAALAATPDFEFSKHVAETDPFGGGASSSSVEAVDDSERGAREEKRGGEEETQARSVSDDGDDGIGVEV